ncbi:FAD-binding oxidoreductase [Magnetovibrio sp.]|uniref:NAD(P)/FAD-dependent oxidoreductase n=1 Tax=Magnetovibrio sp. TaxID=2024836 RepID=UPI002F95CC7D
MSTIHNDRHADSYYAASANPAPERAKLEGEVSCDVCVIGAGITGSSAALHLAEQGYNVVVLEGRQVGWGASGRNGGQAIIGYNKGIRDIAGLVGRDDAQKLWDLGLESKKLLTETVEKHNIQCDLKWGHLMMAIKPRQFRELEETKEELETETGYQGLQMLSKAEARDRVGSDKYIGALYDPESGHLHPLNYTLGLAAAAEAAGAKIYENSPATHIQEGAAPVITTPSGSVRCKHVIMCANAYLEKLEPRISSKIMPVGTFIIATEPLDDAMAKSLIRDDEGVVDINFVLNYWRLSADKRMLFGGRVSYSGLVPFDLKATMGNTMRNIYPQLQDARIDYAWGGNVAITVNRLPHFGRVGKNIYFAHGFSGHGVLFTGLAGKLMAEAVQGTAERFDVFTRIPHMSFPGGALMRKPALVAAMAYFKLRDLL